MPEQKKHLRLFVASPGDVAPERDAVEEVVKHYNICNPSIHIDVIRWEDYSTPGVGRPQELIFENTDFENTDIFAGIFWSRMGTPTGETDPDNGEEYLSGTVEEIKAGLKLVEQGRILRPDRFMLYFSDRDVPFINLQQAALVQKFRYEIKKRAMCKSFKNTSDFKYEFRRDLDLVLQNSQRKEERFTSENNADERIEIIKDSQGKSAQVFICYAREDFKTAERLYEDLQRAGVKPWMDDKDISVGRNWKIAIDRAIRESKWFCALLSSSSISKRGYVQKELKTALDILDTYPDSETFLLPVRLDDCEPVDEKLRYINYADISKSYCI